MSELKASEITEEQIIAVEDLVGCGCLGWDMVDPEDIIAASVNVVSRSREAELAKRLARQVGLRQEANQRADQLEARVKLLEADRDRLNFLLRFITVEDVGDEEYVPGVIVNGETLELVLTFCDEVRSTGVNNCIDTKDVRVVIDRTIEYRKALRGETSEEV